ncbi:hypothetical protein, partial [uncultured Campylobacter sp.]|uniref:hypothetical protein n=1 Tax=uncultured Campylobacter sp. TaxID=218934 RepID=UPI0026148E69
KYKVKNIPIAKTATKDIGMLPIEISGILLKYKKYGIQRSAPKTTKLNTESILYFIPFVMISFASLNIAFETWFMHVVLSLINLSGKLL